MRKRTQDWCQTLFFLMVLLSLCPDTAQAQWVTNGSNIYNSNTGNVGIGTTSPQTSLDMVGGSGLSVRAGGSGTPRSLLVPGQLYLNTDGSTSYYLNSSILSIGWAGSGLITTANGLLTINPSGGSPLVLQGNGGNVGIGTMSPYSSLNIAANGTNISGKGMILGTVGDAITYTVPVGTETGRFELGFAGYRDCEPNQIGAKIAAIRKNNFVANQAYIQSTDLAFFTGPGSAIPPGSNGCDSLAASFHDTSFERMRITMDGNVGIGTTAPTTKLHVVGDVTVTGNIAAKYQDVAEWVPASRKVFAGTVVVLDSQKTNQVLPSKKPYDTRVAGVITDTPGLLLGEGGKGKVKVATTGRVKVKVDASQNPIEAGDLLVTSDKEGFAMKSEPLDLGGVSIHRPGTLIGKALEPLKEGEGEILVLLSLQ